MSSFFTTNSGGNNYTKTSPDDPLYEHYCHTHKAEYRNVDRIFLIETPELDHSNGPNGEMTDDHEKSPNIIASHIYHLSCTFNEHALSKSLGNHKAMAPNDDEDELCFTSIVRPRPAEFGTSTGVITSINMDTDPNKVY